MKDRVVDQWQKLEIPLFYGEDAFSWLDRIERYFAVKGVRKEQWLYAAKVAIGGKAITWFRWWEENTMFQSWPIFKNVVTKRFHPELVQNPFEVMLDMKQKGTVHDFRKKFELYSSTLHMTERRYLVGIFLNGLKDEVRAKLKLHIFNTLDKLMDLAELVESHNALLNKGNHIGPMRFGFIPSSRGAGGVVPGLEIKVLVVMRLGQGRLFLREQGTNS